jgi:hypothetical protein
MKKPLQLTSLATGSDKQYYQARARVTGTRVKFQVECYKLNRDYGAMFMVATVKNKWIADAITWEANNGDSNLSSLHPDSNEKYVTVQFRLPTGTNKIQVQMKSQNKTNRDYGLAFSVYQIGLHASLKAMLKD